MADGDWPQEENAVILAVHLSATLEVRQLERDLLALVRHFLLYHNHPGKSNKRHSDIVIIPSKDRLILTRTANWSRIIK